MDTQNSSVTDRPADSGQTLTPLTGEHTRFISLTFFCLGFVILADVLFYRQPLGWTLGGYGLALMGSLFLRQKVLPRGVPIALTSVAVVLLFGSCIEEPGTLKIVLGILGLCSLGLMLREGWVPNALTWLARWALFFLTGWFGLFKDLSTIQLPGEPGTDDHDKSVAVILSWCLGLVLAIVFIALFASANPIILDWLKTVWEKIGNFPDHFPAPGRILMWILVAIGVWALLRFRTGVLRDPQDTTEPSAPVLGGLFSAGLIAKYLLLFNAIFAVQTVLDVHYLWGGATLPKGLTYAEYAHRGAYPLLAAAILAGIFVMAAFRSESAGKGAAWARRLVFLWLGQNIFLVVSAGWRLSLYIEVYTLTRWRIAAMIWMFLVACGLVWILIRIGAGRSNLWFINANALTGLAVLFLCSFVNFDGRIGDFNVRHCREVAGQGPPIDVEYLQDLGYDTLPALVWLADHIKSSPQAPRVGNAISYLRRDLQNDLRNWRGWTFRRERLRQLGVSR